MLSSVIETGLMVLEPAYRTYKQLKPKESVDESSSEAESFKKERRRLLIHWIVYAVFRAVDCILRNWLPLYCWLNIGAVLWLRSDDNTEKVYRMTIEPFLADHEEIIDQWLGRFNQARDKVNNATTVLGSVTSGTRADRVDNEMAEELTDRETLRPPRS